MAAGLQQAVGWWLCEPGQHACGAEAPTVGSFVCSLLPDVLPACFAWHAQHVHDPAC